MLASLWPLFALFARALRTAVALRPVPLGLAPRTGSSPRWSPPANLAVVIVSFDGKELLAQCLPALYRALARVECPHRILVVDNGSSDGTPEWLAAEHPRVSCLRLGHNAGFGEGNNHAFAQVREDVVVLLNNDMIGNSAGIDGVVDNTSARVFAEGTRATETAEEARQRRYTGGEVDSPTRNLARYVARMAAHVPNLEVMMVYLLDRYGRGGHHRPFNDLGYPAVRVMETHEHYDRQHQDLRTETDAQGRRRVYGDTIDGVDFAYAAKLTALNVVTLAGLAAAPPPPANVAIEGAVSPDTTLKWTRPDPKQAPNLAGYKVYWRLTTEPQWTHSRWVGDVDAYTLEDIVIDNHFFGVAAVAKDGNESPVVFPGAAGSFGGY